MAEEAQLPKHLVIPVSEFDSVSFAFQWRDEDLLVSVVRVFRRERALS
jgi:hypothetical protein